ncbi:MAG TPA: MbnP family copper-binding protein [Candidatus Elarobacter sp.]|jgi:uncharacterized repeat protein (TIGR04052 family)|nr:MbnP family copper-binding protein [Candidatus Elarobacter sp.]
MKRVSFLAAALLLLGATPAERVGLRFAVSAGSAPVACQAKIPGLGTTRATIVPQDLRFYVSEVKLVRSDGTEVPVALDDDRAWQAKGVALLSWCADGKSDVHDVVTGTVPAGTYRGVRFALGVPDALNHADATIAEAPLNVTGMYWSWRSGYKFLRFDVRSSRENGASPSTWLVHLGSTGCTTASGGAYDCRHPNRPTIALRNYDWHANAIVLDVAQLVAKADLTAHSGGTECMSDPSDDAECAPPFAALGLGAGATPQSVFHVR